MMTRPRMTLLVLTLLACATARGAAPGSIQDKTLVAWVRLADRSQRGVGLLTLENLPGQFDSIVLGEIEPGKWMAGSDYFRRTLKNQNASPVEMADPATLVQVAVVTRGENVQVFRDGKLYSSYVHENEPVAFDPARRIVLMGLRLWELTGPTLRGTIADARIYDRALSADEIARLKCDRESDPRPLAWWDFQDGTPRDRMGTFPAGHLVGAARIAEGELRLDGGYLLVGAEPPRTRDQEEWPTYHIAARPQEGLCRPYDANGCIYWKGRYHLMYI